MGSLESGIFKIIVIYVTNKRCNFANKSCSTDNFYQNLPQYDQELMTKYGKVVGYFDGPCPNLLVTDTEIIKSVFVKDFDHFINRKVGL